MTNSDSSSNRPDGRSNDQLRPFSFTRDFTRMADGSVMVAFGDTQVLCTASVDEGVPRWLKDTGKGWVTAEYSMLPGSTPERNNRRASGRDKEIQRLIGRSLRSVVDLEAMGEVSITVDCDVLQADGGTRTASICGGYVALHDAFTRSIAAGKMDKNPMSAQLAAISVGVIDGEPRLDLPYVEDANADVDMNVVMTSEGKFVELQGTAEEVTFDRTVLNQLLDLAEGGIKEIMAAQLEALAAAPGPRVHQE